MPWRGLSFLSGAQQVPVQRRLKSLSQSKRPRASRFLSPRERGWSARMTHHRLRAPSLPSTPGAMAPSGAAIMAPSPGATNTGRVSRRRRTDVFLADDEPKDIAPRLGISAKAASARMRRFQAKLGAILSGRTPRIKAPR